MTIDPSTGLNPELTLDTFVGDSGNAFAFASARAVAANPGAVNNPLYLFGPCASGKTHLLHAIGNEIRRVRPLMRVRYLTAVAFASEFMEALRAQSAEAFRVRFRHETDLLLLDDVEKFSGRDQTQVELFSVFNALRDRNVHVVLASRRYPRDAGLEARLSSRFASGLVADVQPLGMEGKLAILRILAGEVDVTLPDDVQAFLARHIGPDPRRLRPAMARLRSVSGVQDVPITLTLARECLGIAAPYDPFPVVSPEEILSGVARLFNIRIADMTGTCRRREFVGPRHMAMWLIRHSTTCSLPLIGRLFGGRDHTTVIHAVRKIDADLVCDAHTRALVGMVVQSIGLPIDLDRLSAHALLFPR